MGLDVEEILEGIGRQRYERMVLDPANQDVISKQGVPPYEWNDERRKHVIWMLFHEQMNIDHQWAKACNELADFNVSGTYIALCHEYDIDEIGDRDFLDDPTVLNRLDDVIKKLCHLLGDRVQVPVRRSLVQEYISEHS